MTELLCLLISLGTEDGKNNWIMLGRNYMLSDVQDPCWKFRKVVILLRINNAIMIKFHTTWNIEESQIELHEFIWNSIDFIINIVVFYNFPLIIIKWLMNLQLLFSVCVDELRYKKFDLFYSDSRRVMFLIFMSFTMMWSDFLFLL